MRRRRAMTPGCAGRAPSVMRHRAQIVFFDPAARRNADDQVAVYVDPAHEPTVAMVTERESGSLGCPGLSPGVRERRGTVTGQALYGTLGIATVDARVEHVGNLLRPGFLRRPRCLPPGRADPGRNRWKAAEDRAVRAVVAMQEEIGLPVVGDGEMRASRSRTSSPPPATASPGRMPEPGCGVPGTRPRWVMSRSRGPRA
jgi:hypothetical protein